MKSPDWHALGPPNPRAIRIPMPVINFHEMMQIREGKLVADQRTLKGMKYDMRKGKQDDFMCVRPGWEPERKKNFGSHHPRWHRQPPHAIFPVRLASTEGEVMKRGETALRHQVILLPIALWLRTQSPNFRELYLFYSFSLKGVSSLSHFPFEVLFQRVANSSNDLRLIWAWMGRRAEVVDVRT